MLVLLALMLWCGYNYVRTTYMGQEGEYAAKDKVEELYYGDVASYTYTVDHRNGLATMEFTIEGSPEQFREYFILQDRMFWVDTDRERGQVAKLLIEKNPNDFRKCLKAYDKLQELIKEHKFDYEMFNDHFDHIRGNQEDIYYNTVETDS